MESASIIIYLLINIIISFGIPIGALVYFIRKKNRCVKPYFIGMLVFFISQMILRIPLLNNVISKMDWYMEMSTFYPVIVMIFLGLTAGVFEEVGRYLGFKIALKNNRRWIDGIAFGIGHGGIEAMLLLGMASLQNLFIVISKGNESVLNILYSNGPYILLGGFERIFAIMIHIGLTMIVLYGINKNKIRYLFLAIILHGLVDFIVVLLSSLGINILLVEGWVGICALGGLIVTIKYKRVFEKNKGVY
ncbi:YhfC family intramembrane metalloprotease [Clostridium sp. LIBA-8841]|uniref:YhfC family intramembrane metalloprotease n=1 Tax=Clostridium sp. LIBA-8841 TaxID=2987530 RepID=UPI002AC682C5|nr:YhfC family glutamic-type intramembrane protease [Clostridium sp. LIBA-8841]MDZ5252623.1 YhfC family intramembrane metalloprotease [Clostridium sp. LIBA-8841]